MQSFPQILLTEALMETSSETTVAVIPYFLTLLYYFILCIILFALSALFLGSRWLEPWTWEEAQPNSYSSMEGTK